MKLIWIFVACVYSLGSQPSRADSLPPIVGLRSLHSVYQWIEYSESDGIRVISETPYLTSAYDVVGTLSSGPQVFVALRSRIAGGSSVIVSLEVASRRMVDFTLNGTLGGFLGGSCQWCPTRDLWAVSWVNATIHGSRVVVTQPIVLHLDDETLERSNVIALMPVNQTACTNTTLQFLSSGVSLVRTDLSSGTVKTNVSFPPNQLTMGGLTYFGDVTYGILQSAGRYVLVAFDPLHPSDFEIFALDIPVKPGDVVHFGTTSSEQLGVLVRSIHSPTFATLVLMDPSFNPPAFSSFTIPPFFSLPQVLDFNP